MRLNLFILLLICNVRLTAQHVQLSMRRIFPPVGAYSQKVHDPFSVTAHQAQLAFIKQPAVGLFSERRFMMKDLSLLQSTFVFPHRSGGYGLTITHAGNRFYNETTFGLGFGRRLSNILSLGVQFNYFLARTAAGLSVSTIGFESGVLIRMSENFQAGFHIRNPLSVTNDHTEKPPVLYTLGMAYDIAERLLLTASVEKQANIASEIIVAMRYAFHPSFYVDTGVLTRLQQFFIGFGLVWENKQLQLTACYHNQLGFTPALTLIFPFGNPVTE